MTTFFNISFSFSPIPFSIRNVDPPVVFDCGVKRDGRKYGLHHPLVSLNNTKGGNDIRDLYIAAAVQSDTHNSNPLYYDQVLTDVIHRRKYWPIDIKQTTDLTDVKFSVSIEGVEKFNTTNTRPESFDYVTCDISPLSQTVSPGWIKDFTFYFPRVPRPPAIYNCTRMCNYSADAVDADEVTSFQCFISHIEDSDWPINYVNIYWGRMTNVTNCFDISGCEANTWNSDSLYYVKHIAGKPYELNYTASGNYIRHTIGANAVGNMISSFFSTDIRRSCPSEPDVFPGGFNAEVFEDGYKIQFNWNPLTKDTEWNDHPPAGKYRIYQDDVQLSLGEEEYYNELHKDMKNASISTANVTIETSNPIVSLSLNISQDTVSCINVFQVSAVSTVGPGPNSPPMCVMLNKQAPLVTANLTFVREINFTSAEIYFDSIPASHVCGSTKYVVMTIIYMDEAFVQLNQDLNMTYLKYISATDFAGNRVRLDMARLKDISSDIVAESQNLPNISRTPGVKTPTLDGARSKNWTLLDIAFLKNISTTVVAKKGELSVDEARYITYRTHHFEYEIEFPRVSNCECNNTLSECRNLSSYLKQTYSYNYTFSNLSYYRNYTVMAHLCNSLGCGDASEPLMFVSGEGIPSCPPDNLAVEETTSTSIVFVWETIPRECSNGFISQYTIRLYRTRYGTIVERNVTTKRVEMEGLESYEIYCAIVSGATYVGMGPYSDRVCVYTAYGNPAAAPRLKAAFTNLTSLSITIVPTDPYELNGILENVILYYQPVAVYTPTNGSYIPPEIKNDVLNSTNVSAFQHKMFPMKHYEFFNGENSTEHQVRVDDLSTYTFYAFYLAYQTNHSIGPKTSTYVLRTKEGVPLMAPFNFNGSGYDAYSILLSWEDVPIAERRGIIRGYWINYSKVIQYNNTLDVAVAVHVNKSEMYDITSIKYQLMLKELPRDSFYNISVHAYTDVGVGVESSILTIKTGPYADGNYTEWTKWGKCSQTCEEGTRTRSKSCTNPAPWNGGYNCSGEEVEIEIGTCYLRRCDVNGTLTEWTPWGFCTVSCGGGICHRNRRCYYDGYVPPGISVVCKSNVTRESKPCNEKKCPGLIALELGNLNCTVDCKELGFICGVNLETGDDTQIFKDLGLTCSSDVRHANWTEPYHPLYQPRDNLCVGYKNVPEKIECAPHDTVTQNIKGVQRICNCIDPNELMFTQWASWGICSPYCTSELKPALHTRLRKCKDPEGNCIGQTKMQKPCNVSGCPIDGVWAPWGERSECNKTCGYGYQNRTRICDNPAPKHGGMDCYGISVHIIPGCNAFPCPRAGGVSNWTEWSISEKPCGVSMTTRRRYCNNPPPMYRGEPCKEHLIEYRAVEHPPCPRLTVNYIMKFVDEKWHYTMYYGDREKATALKMKIVENVKALHAALNMTNITSVITFKELRRGSVIADFTVEYLLIDRDQIVTLNANLMTTSLLNNMSIADHVDIKISGIPCTPPVNITHEAVDPTTVKVTWKGVHCNTSLARIYIYFMKADQLLQGNISWRIWGNNATNATNPVSFMYVPDLETAVWYEGYLLHSIIGIGNGPPSKRFNFMTSFNAPFEPPKVVSAISNAPTKITVDWSKLPKQVWGGQLLGYKVRYKMFIHKDFAVKIIHPGYQTTTLTNLTPYTLYWIEVAGFNSAGDGPPQYDVTTTQQGVPSVVVPHIKMWTKQDISWWAISWGPIPSEFHNGILLGYRITYYMSFRAGQMLGGELTRTIIDVDNVTFFQKVSGLVHYARYDVTVAGFTIAGEGPSEMNVVDTCNCDRDIFFNWYDRPPYVHSNELNVISGIFPRMMEEILTEVCGSCKHYKTPKFHYYHSITGENPKKEHEHELKLDISPGVDVSFPIYGQSGRTYIDNSLFVLIVKSSGCSLIVRGRLDKIQELKAMIEGILQVWPLMLISYSIAAVAGTLAWVIEQHYHNTDFVTPAEKSGLCRTTANALKGVVSGFWWAFVTMTTMGYGDQINQSIPGRIVAMIWFLTGLVLNGILIGSITSSLTIIGQAQDPVLYNTKTAAIYNSFEYIYAIRHNAKVSPDVKYLDISSMLDALVNEDVDIAMLDTFALAHLGDTLEEKNLKIAEMIDTNSGYGVVLGGLTRTLAPAISSEIMARESFITNFIASFKDFIPEMEKAESGEAQEDILSGESYGFQMSSKWIFVIIAILVFFGIIYELCRRTRSRMKVENKENNKTRLFRLQELVDDFTNNFSFMLDEMEEKHRAELFRLLTIKEGYKRMVALEGKDVVDRRLLISEIQAKRRAVALGNNFIESKELLKFNIRSRSNTGLSPVERIDSTSLY